MEDALKEGTKKPPKGKQYTDNKPVITKPKDKPKNKEDDDDDAIKVNINYKLPPEPNQKAGIDPFKPPLARLKEFIRAISGESATKQVYGGLELWPQIYTPVTFNYTADVIGTGRRQAQIEKSFDRFMAWHTKDIQEKQSDADVLANGAEIKYNFFDQAMLIAPETPGDFTGPMTPIYGQQPIWDEVADTVASGTNAYIGGLRGVVWMGTEAKGDTPATGGVNFVVRPSGVTDLSDRLWEGGDFFPFESVSHGSTQTALGVGKDIFIPRSLTEKTKEEFLEQIAKERELLSEATYSQEIIDERLEELSREEAEITQGVYEFNRIRSIPDMLQSVTALFAEVIGLFPIKIVIEKGNFLNKKIVNYSLATVQKIADPKEYTKIEDLPEKTLIYPNIAETLAELTGAQLQLSGIIDLQTEMLLRLCADSVASKQLGITHYALTDAIADYLGFPIEHVKGEYLSRFDPYVAESKDFNSIHQLLIGAKVEYEEPIFQVGKNSPTLTTQLIYLLKAAKITEAALYQEVGNKAGGKLKDYMEIVSKGLEIVNGTDARNSSDQPTNWDFNEWLTVFVEENGGESIRQGDAGGEAKTVRGKPYANRPKAVIKQVGGNHDPAHTYGSTKK